MADYRIIGVTGGDVYADGIYPSGIIKIETSNRN